MINHLINELVNYGLKNGLIDLADEVYVTNSLLELFGLNDYVASEEDVEPRKLHLILEDMIAYAIANGVMKDVTIAQRDLFDTKVMGVLTPAPSTVRRKFAEKYENSPKHATQFYYQFSQITNYIRVDRIEKDEKWTTETDFGTMDITINLSKPEKDPRDIIKAGMTKKSGYPACLLCRENEGYAGHIMHPARQNHRIIPLTLCEEDYYLQYSPYVYYNEHCIIFNYNHIPMVINKATFGKLLDFVRQFPHYTLGSNADLPIVGGSILSHDHFQGGGYVFAMAKAPYESEVVLDGYPNVHAGIVKWPMSVIRLSSKNRTALAAACADILSKWRTYTDEVVGIFAETDGILHNTITPIARATSSGFECDLVLRNNITTKERPLGVFHPNPTLHHIKKENIGLIEVMGLAVLPARLADELTLLKDAMLSGKEIATDDKIASHAIWASEILKKYSDFNADNAMEIIRYEVGRVFEQVLEDAGVFKRDKQGKEAFARFVEQLG